MINQYDMVVRQNRELQKELNIYKSITKMVLDDLYDSVQKKQVFDYFMDKASNASI
jgi:hypothetical protein